jgi:hypothetical protein
MYKYVKCTIITVSLTRVCIDTDDADVEVHGEDGQEEMNPLMSETVTKRDESTV